MNETALITPSRIVTDVEAAGPREAIQLLSRLLADDLGIDVQAVKDVLLAREKLGSTAIGRGVALPHAKSDAVTMPEAAMAVLREPLACATQDGVPVDIFIAILLPGEGSDPVFLSKLVKHLRDDAVLETLRSAGTPAELHAAFQALSLS